ncbi:MAG: hypothetical protein P8Q36_00055 [Alphaproteobacteria bacterium]|nr:hypothetical protein [Rhodospirillaceae bacterium]MBT7615257.1 hypothetical protein [Rhodospirillaceae bacterium]MBT7646648.1 hypothetical protein [Rhodospirillaceae bacterium]MDG2479252.1 hypothetical protein [Alphaproteobacteria bacterium]
MTPENSELLRLASDPNLYISRLSFREEFGIVRQVHEETYLNSPFMDDMRMIGVEPGEERYSLSQLIEATGEPKPSLWLFHIGHTGSTALSRALSASSSLLPVREPQILNL